jgi:hypothetical protein
MYYEVKTNKLLINIKKIIAVVMKRDNILSVDGIHIETHNRFVTLRFAPKPFPFPPNNSHHKSSRNFLVYNTEKTAGFFKGLCFSQINY